MLKYILLKYIIWVKNAKVRLFHKAKNIKYRTTRMGSFSWNQRSPCSVWAWHTGVCLPVLVLSEFLCLSLSFPKHIDTHHHHHSVYRNHTIDQAAGRRADVYRGEGSVSLLASAVGAGRWVSGHGWSHGDGNGHPALSLADLLPLLLVWWVVSHTTDKSVSQFYQTTNYIWSRKWSRMGYTEA